MFSFSQPHFSTTQVSSSLVDLIGLLLRLVGCSNLQS